MLQTNKQKICFNLLLIKSAHLCARHLYSTRNRTASSNHEHHLQLDVSAANADLERFLFAHIFLWLVFKDGNRAALTWTVGVGINDVLRARFLTKLHVCSIKAAEIFSQKHTRAAEIFTEVL